MEEPPLPRSHVTLLLAMVLVSVLASVILFLLWMNTKTVYHFEFPEKGHIEITPIATPTPEPTITPSPIPTKGISYTCEASWYSQHNLIRSRKDLAGDGYSAASRDFVLGTRLMACNGDGSRCVDLVVNDYGPEAWTGRCIDLEKETFAKLESLSRGVTQVTLTKL